jgi:VWFA-related protein
MPRAGAQDSDTAVFRTGVADVRVDVQVLDNGNIVRGLKAEDFVVTDENQPQKILSCDQESARVSLVLLLDISGSMQKYLEVLARNANEALQELRPSDRVATMVFATTATLHQEFSDNLAETARQLLPAIHDHDVGTSTKINAAVLEAAHYIDNKAGTMNGHTTDPGRRAILIVTDNLGMNYQSPDNTVIQALLRADATLNGIVVGRDIRPRPYQRGDNPDFTPADIHHLAEESGGDAIRADQSEFAFREMLERIRWRYTLAYHAPGGADGSFRHIHVELTAEARRRFPNAVIYARTGYYVTAA